MGIEEKDNRKIVEIRRGDEYRAKVESELKPGELFSSVYRRAEQLVREIIKQSDNFSKDKRFINRYGGKTSTRGYGNNVVIFCAGRGEGKTSAMQSFSSYLSREIEGDKLLGDKHIAKEYDFSVIESIDPSMMGDKDSIVEALLSRLFYRFDNTLQKYREDGYGKDTLFYERNTILKLFSDCYQDINYFIEGKNKDYFDDNLELLAGLGSRIYMRDHLYQLVDKYLSFNYKDNKRYLVVQIDDADLFAGNVFKVCEEIRWFLAVPNIIVLMACDFDQLTMAIDQQYYEKHRVLKDFYLDKDIIDTCQEMSLKYLEKVLPEDRRIYIPHFRISGGDNSHKCIMRVFEMEKQKSIFSNDEKDSICKDMHEQLLRLIYDKTGMILEKEIEPNSILPKTFRELIQMTKLLLDMKDVDGYKVIEEKFNEDKEKIHMENLRKNLKRFRYFFINYWCKANLHVDERKLIDRIYEYPGDVNYVINYLTGKDDYKNNNIDDLLSLLKHKKTTYVIADKNGEEEKIEIEITEKKRDSIKLFDAIKLQYTLVLNRCFMESALNGSTLQNLTDIMVSPVEKKLSEYPIHFEVDKILCNDRDIVNFTNLFCRGNSDDVYTFDFWNPVKCFMETFPEVEKYRSVEYAEVPQEMIKLMYLLKIVLTNPCRRYYFNESMKRLLKKAESIDLWDEALLKLLEVFCIEEEQFSYLKTENVDIDFTQFRSVYTLEIEKIFLSNKTNREKYIEENSKEIKRTILEIKKTFTEDGRILNNKYISIYLCKEKVIKISEAISDSNIKALNYTRNITLKIYDYLSELVNTTDVSLYSKTAEKFKSIIHDNEQYMDAELNDNIRQLLSDLNVVCSKLYEYCEAKSNSSENN